MESKLSRWCDGLIEAGWLTAIIITPLFFNIHSDRVFEPDKLTLLRSIAVVMVVAWLVKFVDQKLWQESSRLSWRNEASIWRMPFVLPVALLALIYLISTLFSVTPSISWAGSYQRLQGAYTTLSYLSIFAVTIATMRTRAQVRRVATVVIITSIPVAFYGLLQHFGLDPLPWGGNVQKRVAGHMGNAIFIGAYLIMAVPVTGARIIASFNNILNDEELSAADVVRSSVYIFALAIQLITIYWSGSRGPWLGLLVAGFAGVLIVLVSLRNAAVDKSRFTLRDIGKALVLVVVGAVIAYVVTNVFLNLISGTGRFAALAGPMGSFIAFIAAFGLVALAIFVMLAAQKGWRWLWLSWIILSLIMGGWIVLFNAPSSWTESFAELPVAGDVLETFEEWRELPTIGRLGTILDSDVGTARVRVLIWEGALDLLLPHEPIEYPDGREDIFNAIRPLIGYGPESMYVAYNRFYPPELATIEARNASPDRSHNETFDALVITGLLGFIVWQWLYLSVFYYGFKWLGVLRTKFDRNLLIILWIGMALLSTAVFVVWRGPIYFGVAMPFGSIIGLVLYLIYYALFSKLPEEETRPFQWDRLLVTALIAGILAHYVEIHFGIAIAATRTHFFVYLAVLFVITYLMPQMATGNEQDKEAIKSKSASRRRRASQPVGAASYGLWGPTLLNAFVLALIIGTLGFTFITYSQPPDVDSVEQISASAIFHQSMLVNSKENFSESPFIYMMVILTWVLGVLVFISEMIKDEELRFNPSNEVLKKNRRNLIATLFAVMGVAGFGYRVMLLFFGGSAADASPTELLGQSMAFIWGLLCLWVALRLFLYNRGSFKLIFNDAQLFSAGVALCGLLFALPVMLGGGFWIGAVLGILCAVILYLLWNRAWGSSILPVGVLAFTSLGVGLIYAFFQAFQLRSSILYGIFNPPPETQALIGDYLINEAAKAANLLIYYYLFAFGLMVISAFALSISRKPPIRENGTTAAYAVMAVLVILATTAVYFTNTQVIQADIVYKRGKFYDNQATRNRDENMWENAISIYENAIARAPREDFYYLFLGRAFLELATLKVESGAADTAVLLGEAEERLEEAQEINPLNTDHTANLARLYTRWVNLDDNESDRAERINEAEDNYLDALTLSPHNSIIRNEYGSLALAVKDDCDEAVDIYKESLEIDPYFTDTYFRLGDTLVSCASQETDDARNDLLAEAATALEAGLEVKEQNPRVWLRLGQIYQNIEEFDKALAAYEKVREQDPQGQILPPWNLDFLVARLYLQQGDLIQAEQYAQRALAAAPPEANGEIEQLLIEISGDGAG